MNTKFSKTGWVMAAALGAMAFAGAANAKPTTIDPSKVQLLASQIEAALTQLGCTVSSQQYMNAIQSTVAASGASPSEAEAALDVVQSYTGLCGSQGVAVASVNQTIEASLRDSGPAAAGGPGPGAPIGAPPAFVGGDGSSNYNR